VLVGYFMAGEALGLRTILGTLLVLVSVVVITTTRTAKPIATLKSSFIPEGKTTLWGCPLG